MYKIRTYHKNAEGRVLSWMALVMGLGIGLLYPIFPNFVKSIVHSDSAVSIFYAAMALMTFVAALSSTIILKKVERTTITYISILSMVVTLFLFIFVSKLTELALLNTIKVWFEIFLLIVLSLLVRDFAKMKNLGKEEGAYYKFQNIGFLVGPLLGGFLAVKFGYEFVFMIAASIFFFGFVYFYHKHIVQKHPAIINNRKTSKSYLIHNIKVFFSDKKRVEAYIVTFIFMVWVRFKHIYVPLYVVLAGYLESVSGLVLALAILPLILMEVKVGEYGDKKGIRKPMYLGFFIMALLLISVFLSPYALLNFILLASVSIGGAMIEPLQEYFLLQNMPKEEEGELYGIYMTADPMAYFFAPLIGAIVLFFLPFKALFLIFGIIMLLTSIFVWTKFQHS